VEQYSRLSHATIADTFNDLLRKQWWGVVRVKDSGAWKEFDFAGGGVKVISLGDRRAPPIGQIIVRRCHLQPSVIEQVLDSQRESRDLFGEIMVRQQMISDEARDEAVYEQVLAEFTDLYMWSGARFAYHSGQSRPRNPEFDQRRQTEGVKAVSLSTDLVKLTTKARKTYLEFDELQRSVGSGETIYKFTTAARDKLYNQGGFAKLADADQRVAVLLDGSRSLSEIIAKVPFGMFDTLRLIAKLKKAGAIEQAK
jgi:hypothetical protein